MTRGEQLASDTIKALAMEGYERGFDSACKAVHELLDGETDNAGSGEPWESVRVRLLQLRKATNVDV